MSDLISIAELRSNALRLKAGGVSEDWCAEPDEVLALVEIAEAAHACLSMGDYADSEANMKVWDALDKFDFRDSDA